MKLFLKAPFAGFKMFCGGDFLPTFPFLPFSTAYGFLLNVAGIEMRQYNGLEQTTIQEGLVKLRIAMGAREFPHRQQRYQAIHRHLLGKDENLERNFCLKTNISPARREFLSNIQIYLQVEGGKEFEQRFLDGLEGKLDRYGALFLGESCYLIDSLEIVDDFEPAHWVVAPDSQQNVFKPMRLPVTIDRTKSSKTDMRLFGFTREKSANVPDQAWVEVGY